MTADAGDRTALTLRDRPQMVRIVASSTIGAVLEWFDFFVFASLSGLILGRLFFSPSDPVTQVLLGFATLAVGYFARPVGGIIFGHFGDRLGRKRMLIVTIWLMGAATVLLGLLPTYHDVGLAATIGLVVLRLVQGVAVGGEYGGAALLIVEHAASSKHRGFLSAWANIGASIGFLLASALLAALTAIMPAEQFEAWGWRIPFLVSAVLLLLGTYIRRRVYESPQFERLLDGEADTADTAQDEPDASTTASAPARTVHRLPVAQLLKTQWRGVLVAFAVSLTTLVYYQVALVFVTPYATQHAGFETSQVLTAISIAQLIYVCCCLAFAALSDRIGRRPVIAFGAVGCLFGGFAYFLLIDSGEPILLFLAILAILVFVAATYGPQAAFLAEQFTSDVRYSGISTGYQVAGAVSGLTPLVAFAMLAVVGTWLVVPIMVGLVAVLSSITLLVARETAFLPLSD